MEQISSSQVNKNSIENTLSVVGKAFVFSKTWKIVLLALAGVGVAIYLIWKAGKKSGQKESIDYNQLPVPNEITVDPISGKVTGGGVSSQDIEAYKTWLKTDGTRLADSLFVNLGFTWNNVELEKTLEEVRKLTDSKLTGLNNLYNLKYVAKRATLLKDLTDKTYVYYSDYQRNEVVNRLKILGAA